MELKGQRGKAVGLVERRTSCTGLKAKREAAKGQKRSTMAGAKLGASSGWVLRISDQVGGKGGRVDGASRAASRM